MFEYTPVDLESSYDPPDIGPAADVTRYTYNLDKQLTRVSRPDGTGIDLGYDAGGRLSAMTLPRGTVGYEYSPDTGQLAAITAPDGGGLGYTYDGFLPLTETWSGSVAGSVARAYSNDFRVTSEAVNDRDGVAFVYDDDGLMTRAGDLSISRDLSHGLPVETALRNVGSTNAYNRFGELAQADVSGSSHLELSLDPPTVTADTLQVAGQVPDAGRITVNGVDMTLAAGGSVSGEVALVLGPNSLEVEVYDRAGALAESASAGVRRESALVLSVDPPTVTADTLQVAGQVPDAGRVTVNGVEMTLDAGGGVSGEVPLALGYNELVVQVYDAAGALSESASAGVERDGTATGVSIFRLVEVTGGGDAYFIDEAGAMWRLAAGAGTPTQPAWLAGAADVSADSAGGVYLLKGTALSVWDGAGEQAVDELGAYAPISDLEVGPDDAVYFYGEGPDGAGLYRLVPASGALGLHATVPTGFSTGGVTLDASAWGLVAFGDAFYRVQGDGTVAELHRPGDVFRIDPSHGVDAGGRLCYLSGLEVPQVTCRAADGTLAALTDYGTALAGVGFDGAGRLHVATEDNVYREDLGGGLIDGTAVSGTLGIGIEAIAGTLSLDGTAGAMLYAGAYTRDQLGRITEKSETVLGEPHTEGYAYDSAGRLTEVTRDGAVLASYSYDANGNRLAKTTPSGTETGTYDAQ
ncbi:MAG: hypothetical protein GWN71_26600, partial [Gammaproteobacteria bacterium]|nr:hypothetical protein [Gammaproteobacteria bacterium]